MYRINRVEAIIMYILLLAYIFYLFKFNKSDINSEMQEYDELTIKSFSMAFFLFFCGQH